MSTLLVVLLVAAALLVALALGGAIATGRRVRAGASSLHQQVEEANRQLAAAHAEDRGWERGALEGAAREAFAAAHPGEELAGLDLVQVIDRPGTDEDEALFRATTAAGGSHELRLGRSQGVWVPAGR